MKTILFISVVVISSALNADTCEPSSRHAGPSLMSPDYKYELLNLFCLSHVDGQEMAFVLRDVSANKRRTLYVYGRAANALWSPGGQRIAVNDFAGSDYTNNVVISVRKNTASVDVKEHLLRIEPKDKSLQSDHLYLSITQWKSPDTVKVLAWGHDSTSRTAFCECFLVSLAGSASKCEIPTNKRHSEEYCDGLNKSRTSTIVK